VELSILPTIAIQIVSTRISECALHAIQICKKPCVAGLSFDKKPDKSARRHSEPNCVQILSQNTRGFDNDKEEMVLAIVQQKNMAYTIQET
jgi:hypothetical protein